MTYRRMLGMAFVALVVCTISTLSVGEEKKSATEFTNGIVVTVSAASTDVGLES